MELSGERKIEMFGLWTEDFDFASEQAEGMVRDVVLRYTGVQYRYGVESRELRDEVSMFRAVVVFWLP